MLLPALAQGQLKLDWRGYIDSDLRFVIDDKVPFERSETTLQARVAGKYGKHVGGVADVEMTFVEMSSPQTFAHLTDRQALDSFRFESDALFVEFTDMGLDGLDMRMGRQKVIWGAADRFHPTSNLNALDVEDALAFGETLAAEMITLQYRPYFTFGDEDEPWFEEFSLQLAWAPMFKPAQLPQSAAQAFTLPDETIRLASSQRLKDLARLQKGYLDAGAVINYDIQVHEPEFNIENSAVAARMAWNIVGIDMSVSYFRGFDDFPRGEKAIVTGDAANVDTEIHLTFPRVQVIGVDLATSLPFLDGVGLWGEVGITLHDDLFVVVDGTRFAGFESIPELNGPPVTEFGKGMFVKGVAGLDYTPLPWWYINIQYLHGFVDEFGADELEDYLVAGMDFKLFHDKWVIRIFSILNFQDLSHVIFPQFIFRPWSASEISVGAFLFSGLWGKKDTKFGSPVAGQSTVFVRGRYSF